MKSRVTTFNCSALLDEAWDEEDQEGVAPQHKS